MKMYEVSRADKERYARKNHKRFDFASVGFHDHSLDSLLQTIILSDFVHPSIYSCTQDARVHHTVRMNGAWTSG